MIGATLPQIKSLELEALTDGGDDDVPEDEGNEDIVTRWLKKK